MLEASIRTHIIINPPSGVQQERRITVKKQQEGFCTGAFAYGCLSRKRTILRGFSWVYEYLLIENQRDLQLFASNTNHIYMINKKKSQHQYTCVYNQP